MAQEIHKSWGIVEKRQAVETRGHGPGLRRTIQYKQESFVLPFHALARLRMRKLLASFRVSPRMAGRARKHLRVSMFAASCVLTLGLAALWIDSYSTSTSLSYNWAGSRGPYQAAALPGETRGMWHDLVDSISLLSEAGGVSVSSIRAEFAFYDSPREDELYRGRKFRRLLLPRRNDIQNAYIPGTYGPPSAWPPGLVSRLSKQLTGFSYDHATSPTLDHRGVTVPFLPLVLLALLPALVISVQRRVRARRTRRGSCARCGYSRQGLTPEAICPECGVSPHPSFSAATPTA